MISLLVYVLVVCIVAWLIVWVIGQFPLPAPLGRVIPVVVWVIAALLILSALLPLLGVGTPYSPILR